MLNGMWKKATWRAMAMMALIICLIFTGCASNAPIETTEESMEDEIAPKITIAQVEISAFIGQKLSLREMGVAATDNVGIVAFGITKITSNDNTIILDYETSIICEQEGNYLVCIEAMDEAGNKKEEHIMIAVQPSGTEQETGGTEEIVGTEEDTTVSAESAKDATTAAKVTVEEKVEMPNLIGKTWEEAEKILKNAGIAYKLERAENENYAENIVIEQEVKGGSMIEVGRRVIITINSYTTEREIPEGLVGYPLNTVKYQLNKLGLEIEVIEQFNEDVDVGKVISLDPCEGSTVQVADIIKVYVSKGSEIKKEAVPSVAGLSVEDARKRLEDAGFKCEVNEEESETVAEGYVIRQSQSMVSLPVGTTITVYVSVGSMMTQVPQLVGITEAGAIAKLAAVGLRNSVEYREDAEHIGIVVSQSIAANTKIEKGTIIMFVVGVTPTQAPTQAPTDAPVTPLT